MKTRSVAALLVVVTMGAVAVSVDGAGVTMGAVAVSVDGAGVTMGAAPGAAAPEVQGNPFRGRETFVKKGCTRCHSVWAQGGTLGPDISVAVSGKTWDELVGDFWNHTPRMIDEMGQQGYAWPTLDPQEMADTLSYFYYLQLFDEPGDPARGAVAFKQLECAACHTLGGRGGTSGGPLDRLGQYLSPTALATAMWNAGPRMQQAQLRRSSVILRFSGREMADLQAYIRAEGRRRNRDVALDTLPDPDRGALVYREKQCGVCHDRPQGGAPDLSRATLSRTVSEITGHLWNHSYAMGEAMGARGVAFPQFAGSELPDLIASLYFRGYLGPAGDGARGAAVFKTKGCAECHGSGKAPDLAETFKQADRSALASAMWNHAPEMRRLMGDQERLWPRFEPGEMRDLAVFLQRVADKNGTPLARPQSNERRAPAR
jgi:cytochrome c2